MNSITLVVTGFEDRYLLDNGQFQASFDIRDSPQIPLSREHNLFLAVVLERALRLVICEEYEDAVKFYDNPSWNTRWLTAPDEWRAAVAAARRVGAMIEVGLRLLLATRNLDQMSPAHRAAAQRCDAASPFTDGSESSELVLARPREMLARLRVALRALHAADEQLSRALRARCGLSRVATRGWLLGVLVHDAVAVVREDARLRSCDVLVGMCVGYGRATCS